MRRLYQFFLDAQIPADHVLLPCLNPRPIALMRQHDGCFVAGCGRDEPVAVGFDQLADADLILDRVYRGGVAGNSGDDPLARLLPVGNQGGFRTYGSRAKDEVRLAVLYTSGAEPDWPDQLDVHTGVFTYFGDNRSPGRELHDTPRKGQPAAEPGLRAGSPGRRGPGAGAAVPAVPQGGPGT